ELHGIARRPVLAGFLVVGLVEAADQLLENRAHGMIVEAGMLYRTITIQDRLRAEIDRGIEEFLDERAERIGLGQLRDLVAELEIIQNPLHIGRETIEIGFEIRL